jgi:hypothetical protein
MGSRLRRSKRPGSVDWLAAALALLCGCSLPLAEIKVKSADRAAAQVRRAGQMWGCHEQPSELFRVYLVCPKPKFTLGVMERDGSLLFACPDHVPEYCEKLGMKLLRDGSEDSQEIVEW